MAFCASCGQEITAGAAFCPKCGAPTGATAAAAGSTGVSQAPAAGLEENLAGLLCYVLGWVTGLIFLLIDKRPFVRFHAMQSLITFGGLHVINLILVFGGFAGGFMGMGGGMMMGGLSFLIYGLLSVVTLVAWIICMVKAFQGKRYKLPIVGNLAENYSR
jgi:uncharacterized membrane protein